MPHSTNDSTSTQTRMSVPSSTSTCSTHAFPKQAGVAIVDASAEPTSPSASQFSFASSPRSVQGIEQITALSQERPGTRGTTASRRAQYYEGQFAYKDGTASSARDRVIKDAPIVVSLKTNVIIKDEYTLVTDLSHHLSTRYQRPEASIMITVNHSACLLLGGSFEPTYILTINALPVQLQPTTNKRNAALIQNFMCESIGVPADRGILKFAPIQEENLATNGITILGEIERLELQHAEENGGVKRALTKNSRKPGVTKAKSSNMLSSKLSFRSSTIGRPVTTSPLPRLGEHDSAVSINEKSDVETANLHAVDSKINQQKSAPVLSKPSNHPVPTPTPASKIESSRMKRKSLLNIFRR
ncbi:Tautomerase/MIF [Dothidotthia symphoricarpi CBS 119687]|uniref:L-dopachrome isomerase n=1 Tax=Dothidotthia symphoricarpi CBS 119687 TaxID=1392245 RepID=A0A6A6A1K9_9PLEO|nr:Tautomerase/MIF [Dothidotthia symphoricarpi CBS 119687]KAF2124837.1 Tautomerase/MIF [Dothidotthia symphoricarpi CBS 119687]